MPKQRLVMLLRALPSCGLRESCSVRARKTRQNWQTCDTRRVSSAAQARCTSDGAAACVAPVDGTCTATLLLQSAFLDTDCLSRIASDTLAWEPSARLSVPCRTRRAPAACSDGLAHELAALSLLH